MCNRHRIITAREQFEMLQPWHRVAVALPDAHPDLHHSFAVHGTVHTSHGRVMPARTAAGASGSDAFTGPQDTTFKGFSDPKGWTYHKQFEPSQVARQGASAYANLTGLRDPHAGHLDYNAARRTPQDVQAVAQNYDQLPTFDKSAVPHYAAMRDDVNKQHDFMTNHLGIKTQVTDHDPYSDVHEMVNDVNKNKTLKLLGTHVTGGHPFFSDEENDKLRAVHDFFGHAATGRSFDRHGEQAAYLAHAQMFSPHALPALTTETKGQNSALVYHGQFQPQKIGLMNPQHWQGLNPVSSYRGPAIRQAFPAPEGHFDDDWKRDVMDEINHPQTGGGYTLRDRPGDGPSSGVMVSLPKAEGHEEHHLPVRGLSGDDVADYVNRKWDTVHGHPENYAGGWANTGEHGDDKFYQDISRNHADPWDAAQHAVSGDQLGVYDLDSMYGNEPSSVETPEFLHDQIAKGGKRD